jgi:hypothetical protein
MGKNYDKGFKAGYEKGLKDGLSKYGIVKWYQRRRNKPKNDKQKTLF